jgi:uncharacterized membrane protein
VAAVALVLAILAVAWAAAVVRAPQLAGGSLGRPGVIVAAAVYGVGAGVCHQQAGRSFTTGGTRWPVCSRCSGLYLGAAAGVLAAAVARRLRRVTGVRTWRRVLLAALLPIAGSWAVEAAGGPATPLAWRALLAAPAGGVIGVLLVTLAAGPSGLWRECGKL